MTVFSDTSTKLGLIQSCEVRLFGDNGYGQISGDTNRLYQFTARINRAQDRFVFLAMTADGRWQYDDTNYPNYPIATTNMVSGQQDYTFAVEHLEIEKVRIKTAAGVWVIINPIDIADPEAKSYIENNTGNTGQPTRYDKRANSIFLDVVPNYSSTAGLEITFKRGPSYFVFGDTVAVPGFASIFHDFLSLHASYGYASERSMPIAGGRLRNGAYTGMALAVNDAESSIKEFYASRNKDEVPRLKVRQESTK